MRSASILQSTAARLGGVALALMVLAGCGQKGALFLPATAASAAAPAQAPAVSGATR